MTSAQSTREYELEICAECGAPAEMSDRWGDGPYPVNGSECPQAPACGTYGKYPGAGFKRCPGTRMITVVEKTA